MISHPFTSSFNTHRVEQTLAYYFSPNKCTIAPLLQEVMAYTALNGGKRLRPALVYATGETLSIAATKLDGAAAAIELIHCYSLIHDDLPAMDNAAIRRNKPACHKAYDEAMAILAGDALQTLAFEVLTTHPAEDLTDHQRLSMVTILSQASGFCGMAGGQTLDINLTTQPTEAELLQLYRHKTGALLTASVELALAASPVPLSSSLRSHLHVFIDCLGLVFQIQDDLLDIEGNEAALGKPTQQDQQTKKNTYPLCLGISTAKQKVIELQKQAWLALQQIGLLESPLAKLMQQLIGRQS